MAWIGVGVKVFARKQGQRFPLDALGINPAVAYSVRRLRQAYTGPALRVRRSSDNAEQDIGFAPNGWLDTAQLLSFVGSGSGFVTTWYDQIGTNNAVMITPSRQPRIVNAGVLELANSKPSVRFIDTSFAFGHNLEFTRFHALSTPYVAAATVYQLNNDGNFPYVFGGMNDTGFLSTHLSVFRQYRTSTVRSSLSIINSPSTVVAPLNSLVCRFTQADRVQIKDFLNKSNIVSGADHNSDFASFSTYLIGNAVAGAIQDTHISELLFFADTALTAAQRDALQDNQMQAFNI
ncbi:MAG: arabinofuranosidase catalytic domain-containing protein [Candidatus Anstonellaceae archaeon]